MTLFALGLCGLFNSQFCYYRRKTLSCPSSLVTNFSGKDLLLQGETSFLRADRISAGHAETGLRAFVESSADQVVHSRSLVRDFTVR